MSDIIDVRKTPRFKILLGVKIIAAALFLGGVATVLVEWLSSGFFAMDFADPRRAMLIAQTRFLMLFFIVPALLVAIVCGIALARLRGGFPIWLRMKIAILIVMIPVAHFFCSSRLDHLRRTQDQIENVTNFRELMCGFSLVIVGVILIMLLGRFKPVFKRASTGVAA